MSSAERFLALVDERRRAALDPAELQAVLDEKWAAARAAWPQLRVDEEAYVAHLARHLPDDGAPLLRLRELRAEDLYLARACGDADPEALRAFEDGPLKDVRRALERLSRSGVAVDDAL